MKIAIVCDVLGEENNGTTIAAMNLIRSLKAKGHDVRVVCPDEDKAGTPGYYVVPKLNAGPFNHYLEKNGVTVARLEHEKLEAAMKDADVVHVLLPFVLGKAAAHYAVEHGIPLTASFHCQAENITSHAFMKNFTPLNHETYRIFYKRLYQFVDIIHYPTQFICNTFEEVVGPTEHRVISNGVNKAFRKKSVSRPPEFAGNYTVLFTGRYSPEKSHSVLIEAVSRSKHRDEIQLVLAGSGPKREEIYELALKKGLLPPVMRFYGRDELIDVINSADLYVHPAEIEIEAISCLEAIACGVVPLIADSPRSATRFFALTESNLFHFNDPDDLADKMDWWLEHPEARAKCSADYLDYSRRFDFDVCMDEMEQMLFDAVKMKPRAPEGRSE
ncbi:MAG: glycosyltransferase [Clostridia bacterium]|nr:glycosyltransferase [Clostridia bacterium]MBQ3867040.1 glycosyltransferase [Clostridia bacterium]